MKQYPSYKDSGVEWIGDIPIHWDVMRLRNIGFLYGGISGKSGDDFKQDDHPHNKPYIPFTNIANNTYISKNHFHFVVMENGVNQNLVKKFDLFFLMSSETQEDLGKSCILIDDVDELYLNSFCKGLRITDTKTYPLFLNYQLLGHTHKVLISVEGRGFTRINLRGSRLIDTPVFIPPLPEQHQIVSFLDYKTSLIDKLIETKKRKIELLKEYRTSLINQVVTKGLNPNVEMKDSGVEWIGDIPSHWEIHTGSYLGDYSKGNGIKKDEVTESGLPCVRYGEIYTVYDLKFYQTKSFINEETSIKSNSVGYGTLMMTGSGETPEDIGKCIVYLGHNTIWVGGDIIILKPYDKNNPLFLSYLINSECIRVQRQISSKGEIIVHIYSKNFKEMKFTIPPLPEQHQIVTYLDEKTSTIDKEIGMEERKIELLKEYRQSLISEVVTGKIKVTSDE